MADLVKKLKSQIGDDVCEIYSHEALFSEAAAEITRLRAEVSRLGRENNVLKYGPDDFGGRLHQEVIDNFRAELDAARAALADAQAVGFAAGVEAAASRCVGFYVDIDERTVELPEHIRALTPPDLTAAAARVLLGDENALRKLTFAYDREDAAQRGEPNPHTFIDLDAPDMGASWVNERIGCAVSALRAIAGDTP